MNKIWRKIISLTLGVSLTITAFPATALAYTVPAVVRVGLEAVCKNTTTVSVGGSALLIGTERNGRFAEAASVSSSTGFTVTLKTGTYTALRDTLDWSDAADLAEDFSHLGLSAYPAYLGDDAWTVYVENASVSEVEQESRYSAERIGSTVGVLVAGSSTAVLLPQESEAVLMGTGAENTFSINGTSYRGMLSFAIHAGVMTAVNVVDLEEYLYGVVPSEMPQSYESEALKAQAVAARTYAMTKLSSHTSYGYQLCDSVHCQVYKGYSGEARSTTNAVDETAGEIACYNGVPIEAVFSASTGGYTENSENVWNNVVPYLKAVPEIAEDGDNSWTATLTLRQLDDLLSAKGAGIGRAEDIVITKLSTGGRVQEMKIVGSSGSKTLTKEDIRTYFSAAPCGSLPGKMFTINGKGGDIGVYGGKAAVPSQASSAMTTKGGSLAASAAASGIVAVTEGTLSNMNGQTISLGSGNTGSTSVANSGEYEIYSVNISTVSASGNFVFEGVGRGHGVGLSQKGSQSMAKLGYGYEDILKYYYTGITIEG